MTKVTRISDDLYQKLVVTAELQAVTVSDITVTDLLQNLKSVTKTVTGVTELLQPVTPHETIDSIDRELFEIKLNMANAKLSYLDWFTKFG
jgi:hypothetical protein